MAPSTCRIACETTPPNRLKACEADTIKKAQFYRAWDDRHDAKPLRAIAANCQTTSPTSRRWLR
jgi:hypothetical protein